MTRRPGPARRALLALEILWTYAIARWLVRRRPLPDAVTAMRAPRLQSATGAEHLSLGEHLAWATVSTIEPLPLDSHCVMRSLVLTRMLARRRLMSTFVLSAAPGPRSEAQRGSSSTGMRCCSRPAPSDSSWSACRHELTEIAAA